MARTLDWREPPADALLSDTEWAVAELRKHPGKWARVRTSVKTRTVTSWKKAGLEAIAVVAEADEALWDIYVRAPEVADAQRAERAAALKSKAEPAKPTAVKRPKAPSAAPAAEASPAATAAPERLAEEDAAWEERAGRKDPAVVVPKAKPGVKPGTVVAEGDVEAQARVKAQLASRMGHKRSATGVRGRRG